MSFSDGATIAVAVTMKLSSERKCFCIRFDEDSIKEGHILTQIGSGAGAIQRTQWIVRRTESPQKRWKALYTNILSASTYLHTQEVTGSSPAVSTTCLSHKMHQSHRPGYLESRRCIVSVIEEM